MNMCDREGNFINVVLWGWNTNFQFTKKISI